jgi:hypothetical protein
LPNSESAPIKWNATPPPYRRESASRSRPRCQRDHKESTLDIGTAQGCLMHSTSADVRPALGTRLFPRHSGRRSETVTLKTSGCTALARLISMAKCRQALPSFADMKSTPTRPRNPFVRDRPGDLRATCLYVQSMGLLGWKAAFEKDLPIRTTQYLIVR